MIRIDQHRISTSLREVVSDEAYKGRFTDPALLVCDCYYHCELPDYAIIDCKDSGLDTQIQIETKFIFFVFDFRFKHKASLSRCLMFDYAIAQQHI